MKNMTFDPEDLSFDKTFVPAGTLARGLRALERYEELVALAEARPLTVDEEQEQDRLRSGLDTLAEAAIAMAKAHRELLG